MEIIRDITFKDGAAIVDLRCEQCGQTFASVRMDGAHLTHFPAGSSHCSTCVRFGERAATVAARSLEAGLTSHLRGGMVRVEREVYAHYTKGEPLSREVRRIVEKIERA